MLLPDGVRDGGIAIDVTENVDARGGRACRILFEFLDDLVCYHYIVAIADAEADRLSNPECLATEVYVYAVVRPLSCCCFVIT